MLSDSSKSPPNEPEWEPENDIEKTRLERLAWWLDESIELPGGYRIGLDALFGLIPGIGDAAGLIASLYIVVMAAREGVPLNILFKMIWNIVIDAIVGAVPLLGDVFDGMYKANVRNVELIREYHKTRRRD